MRVEAAGRDRPGGSGPRSLAGSSAGAGGIALGSLRPRGAVIGPEGACPEERAASWGEGGSWLAGWPGRRPWWSGERREGLTPLRRPRGPPGRAGTHSSARAAAKGRPLPSVQGKGLCPPPDLPAIRPLQIQRWRSGRAAGRGERRGRIPAPGWGSCHSLEGVVVAIICTLIPVHRCSGCVREGRSFLT